MRVLDSSKLLNDSGHASKDLNGVNSNAIALKSPLKTVTILKLH